MALVLGLGAAVGLVSISPFGRAAAHAAAVSIGTGPSTFAWPEFGFDPQHSGLNTQETALSPGNVAGLHRLFQITLPAAADGAPVYLSGVTTLGGVQDLLFVTTRAGHIIALDAHTGSTVWSHQYPAGTCKINNGSTPCYTTSSPALDPNHQFVYSYGLDGNVHKYAVGDGAESTGSGWPARTSTKPFDEKGSSALSVATAKNGTSYLYMPHAGYPGDNGDYQGHVTTINLATGEQNVFNATCSNQVVHFVEAPGTPDCPETMTAIWGRAGVVYDTNSDRIYTTTGNGTYSPAGHNWGDTVFSLNADGTGAAGNPIDTFTPTNFQQLKDWDADLGSTVPAIMQGPANSVVKHLAVQGGKDAMLRLLNLDDLSSQGGIGHTGGELQVLNVPQGGMVFAQPAVWTNPCDSSAWVFVTTSSGISGLRLVTDGSGNPRLETQWQKTAGGTSPVIANGVLYYVTAGNIQALSPVNGNQLWHDTQIGGIHWESPIVANGVLYVTDESAHLTAYGPTVPAAPQSRMPLSGYQLFLPMIGKGCS